MSNWNTPEGYREVMSGCPGAEEANTQYLVRDTHAVSWKTAWIVAPTGHCRDSDGRIIRDGTKSPEVGKREHAYAFRTHRSAARSASALAYPEIVPVTIR